MSKEKISIRKIAELAGTSVATVSRVINQNGRFSKETEQRVKDIIKQYDYQPNGLARGLRSDKSQAVGVVVPDITNEFFSNIVRTIELGLLKKGYLTVVCDTNESTKLERQYISLLKAMRVGGIIYVSGDQKFELMEEIPAVFIDREPKLVKEKEGYCFIGCDNFMGGYLAGKTLIENGRKNVVQVVHNKTLETQESRMAGFRQAFRDYKLPFHSSQIYRINTIDRETGMEVTKEIWNREGKTDGIFFSSDLLAIGALHYFQLNGIRVPEDVAIIGFDGIPMSRMSNPPITTIRQPYEKFGQLAAETIIRMMEGEIQYDRRILPVKILSGGTI